MIATGSVLESCTFAGTASSKKPKTYEFKAMWLLGKKIIRIVQQVIRSSRIFWPTIKWDMDPISEYYIVAGVS